MKTKPALSPAPRVYPHPLCGHLAAVVQEERIARGVSRYTLAQWAQVARQTLTNAEDHGCVLNTDTLARLCDALGLSFVDVAARAERRRWASFSKASSEMD